MPNLYASLDEFKTDIDFTLTDVSKDAAMLRWLEASSRVIDGFTHRSFYPLKGTLSATINQPGDTVLLEEDIASLTSWTADGDAITNTYSLVPVSNGLRSRPYEGVRLTDGARFYPVTSPIEIAITGVFGWPEDARLLTAVAVQQEVADVTLLVPTGTVPIGALLKIGTEYEQVIGRTTASPNDTLSVTRAVNGSTAAQHLVAASVYRLRPPMSVEAACIAHTARVWKRRASAWANVALNTQLGTMELFKGLDADVKLMLEEFIKYSI